MRIIILMSMFLFGCTDKEYAYVPGPEFTQEIKLSASQAKTKTNVATELIVARSTRGWVKQSKPLFGFKKCHFTEAPPEYEGDVSLNVSFSVSPKAGVTFSVSDEGKRTISFTKAGNYEVKAHSALWCPPGVSAKPITIEVSQ